MRKFKKGDKIRLARHGQFGWEYEQFSVRQLTLNKIYKIESVRTYKEMGDSIYLLNDKAISNVYHPGHFEFAKLSNEERIAKRMEELEHV